MDSVSLTHSQFVHQKDLLSVPNRHNFTNSKQISTSPELESLFFQNLNRSYLVKMSGSTHECLRKDHLQKQTPEKPTTRKRIDFQAFEGVATSQIYQSNFFKGDWDLFEVVSFLEDSEKEIQLDQEPFLCCSGEKNKIVCKAKITAPYMLEFLRLGPNKQYSVLFFSLNFDIVKGKVSLQQLRTGSNIVISAHNYTLIMEPFDKRAGKWWHKQLVNMAHSSIATSIPVKMLQLNPRFYKQRYQTDSYFKEHCQNGDILLFQDSHFFARAQRFLTQSEFDHVGIVVRDKLHGILIFQSNSSSGVCLTPWKYVEKFKWYNTIPRITWRPLVLDRTRQFSNALQAFMIKSIPKQFHFTLAKLTAQESFIMVDEHRKEGDLSNNETNGYFCSELAAATYKQLGLLTTDKSSPNYLPASRFYPKDFSEKAGLKLELGSLGEERDIIFDGEMR